jgi:predicted aspartyl protease
MNGVVDTAGRALIDVKVKPAVNLPTSTVAVWIDTGFTGDLVLPDSMIQALSLPLSGTVGALLADGSKVAMRTYSCLIEWFDGWQHLEVVASDAQYPLLRVGLLIDHDLRIDYSSKVLSIE